jgi:hypothetical protein
MMRALAVASLLLAFSPVLGAQNTSSASFSISGTVVSASTGSPLDRAEVTLSTAVPNGSQVAEGITGENGSFRFDHLEAGNYRLEGSRRGYIAAGYQEHDGFYTGVVAGPGLNTSSLRLALEPTGVIGGTVADESGEPVAGAQVRLFLQDQRNGEERTVGTQTEMTDDSGAYEFLRVRAGTFYVSVSATPWFAFHPGPKTDPSGNLLPVDQQPRSPLDVAYPTTFYENGADSDSATPITVKAGDRVEVDFSLHAVPAIHIQVHLPPPVEGRGMPVPQLAQQAFGADEYSNATQFMAGTPSGGMVADFSGIAPGHYVLRQFGVQGESTGTATVDLTTNQTVDLASTASGVDISGKIAEASGNVLAPQTRVSLESVESSEARYSVVAAGDGIFHFHSVAAGSYDVHVSSLDGATVVLQMLASGAEAQGNRITVAGQPVLLAATLARGATTVTGYARQNNKRTGGVMILLVPRNPALHDLYRRDQTNTDGSFRLDRVVPGDYTLVAIDNGWTLEWARPEVMAPYLARGARVQVTGQRTLELSAPVEVQPR